MSVDFRSKASSTKLLRLKTIGGPPTLCSGNFFRENFIFLLCVDKFWSSLVVCNQASAYRYLCHGKKRSIFALLLKLAQNPCHFPFKFCIFHFVGVMKPFVGEEFFSFSEVFYAFEKESKFVAPPRTYMISNS